MSSLTRIPAGVQYFFDEEVRRRRYVEQTALTSFRGWSYDEIILPMFDYQDLFARGMGPEKADRTYRFTDRDGSLLALRPELTSLVARTVATRFKHRPRPVRLCYSGEVFRYDEPSQRSAREFHQLGLELIGVGSIAADLEVLLIAVETLSALGLQGFRIVLSHVDFFNGISAELGLAEVDRARLRELIDRRDTRALDQFLHSQVAPQMPGSDLRQICQLIALTASKDTLPVAGQLTANPLMHGAVNHLRRIDEILQQIELSPHFRIDLGEVADLDYYTGLTFRIFVPHYGTTIGSGGRYDRLIGNFGAPEPAIGFSLSLDGVTSVLASQQPHGPWQLSDLSVTIENTKREEACDQLTNVFRRARQLREQNRKVLIGTDR